MRPQIRPLTLLSVVALALLVAVSASRAGDGPWCARWGGGQDYVEDCSMRSFDMCLNEIRGTGGDTICSPNPRYRPDGGQHPPVRRKIRHRHRGGCSGLDSAPCVLSRGPALVS